MSVVKVGTRLTMMLLLTVTPAVGIYTYWSVRSSTSAYVSDLKREIRATTRGLAPALENDLRGHKWKQVKNVIERMSVYGTTVALLNSDGERWFSVLNFPQGLILGLGKHTLPRPGSAVEFHRIVSSRHWFCRLVPLGAGVGGYLLVAQDWTNIHRALEERVMWSVAAAVLVMAAIATIIPLLVRRYVSTPLAELSRKVIRFSDDEEPGHSLGRDEVKLLSEEFQRLDGQLNRARVDLTARHHNEIELERKLQRTQRLATIGTLASGLAHEIGTPMGVIRGRAELLSQGEHTTAKTREGLLVIISQIDRISRIVRVLLDYAQGRESLRVVCDVRAIVERTLGLVGAEFARRKVEVISDLCEEPLPVKCDPDQIQQVFINLAMNALDAMTPAGGIFRISTEFEEKGHSSNAKISFADTGPGISPEHRVRVFDPFFTTKEPGKGTGMGLAVSQSIMRDHNGTITLEVAPAGAKFFVTIPISNSAVSTEQNGAALTEGDL